MTGDQLITHEQIKAAILDAIITKRFPGALAIDHPVMKHLEDEAEFYAAVVMKTLSVANED